MTQPAVGETKANLARINSIEAKIKLDDIIQQYMKNNLKSNMEIKEIIYESNH